MVHLAFQVPRVWSRHKKRISLKKSTQIRRKSQAPLLSCLWRVRQGSLRSLGMTRLYQFLGTKIDSELTDTAYFYWPGLPTKLRTPTLHKTQDALDSELPEETNCLPDICFNIRSCSYTSPSMMHAFTASVSVRPRLAFHCIQPATDLSQAPGFVHPMGGQDSKSWANVHVYDGQHYTHRYYG